MLSRDATLSSRFASLLGDTTASYKHLFLRALVQQVRNKSEQGNYQIEIRTLIVEMAAIAWVPSALYKLSFGFQDQVGQIIELLKKKVSLKPGSPHSSRSVAKQIELLYDQAGLLRIPATAVNMCGVMNFRQTALAHRFI